MQGGAGAERAGRVVAEGQGVERAGRGQRDQQAGQDERARTVATVAKSAVASEPTVQNRSRSSEAASSSITALTYE